MVENKNKKEIFIEQVQEFFDKLLALKSSEEMKRYLEFCARMPNHSTFNSTLVFIQKPSCFYYATKSQWENLFHREPKPSARPLVILFPFAPVEFVYDMNDIEGEPLAEKDLIRWYEEEHGGISQESMENLIRLCEELDIRFSVASTDYVRKEGLMTFGIASKSEGNERTIKLHPRYKDPAFLQEAFGVLVHEVAHHLLGHLGEIRKTVQFQKKTIEGFEHLIITKDVRGIIDRPAREVEAELTAYFVFSKYGIAKKSAPYLAGWITKQSAKSVRVAEVGKAAENIYKMSLGEEWWVKKAKRAEKEAMRNVIRFGSA